MSRARAIALVVILMVVWGSTFAVTKAAAREIPALPLALLRFAIAAAVLVPFAIARGGISRLPRPLPLATLSLMALTGIASFTVAFNYALVYGSATQGSLLYAFVPAAIAVAARMFLGETLSRRRLLGVGLSVFGVAVVAVAGESDPSSPRPWLGAAWMLAAVASFAAYTVLAKRLAGADATVVTAAISVLGAAMLLPLGAAPLFALRIGALSATAWIGVLFLGVVASALAYLAYARALRELDASLVGALSNLDPIVGVLTAVLFLGEAIRGGQIAGAVIALAGMWLASVEAPQREETPA